MLIMAVNCSLSGQTPLTFTKIIKTDSVGIPANFNNVKDWFISSYNNAKAVIQSEDKTDGIIIGKAKEKFFLDIWCNCTDGFIDYIIKIHIKENRFKVEICNFTHIGQYDTPAMCILGLITDAPAETINGNMGCNKKAWIKMQATCKTLSESIFTSIEQQFNNLLKSDPNSNW